MVAQTAWVEERGEDGRERKGETALVRVSFYFLTSFWVFTQIDDMTCLWTMIWRIAALQIVEDLDPKEPDKFLRG